MARSPATTPSSFFAPRRSAAKFSTSTIGNDSKNDRSNTLKERLNSIPRALPSLGQGSSWKSRIQFLTPNGSSWILHVPRFYCSFSKQQLHAKHDKNSLLSFQDLWSTHPNHQHSLMLFGRKVLENRYSSMYSKDESIGSYTYSGSSRSCQICDPSKPHEKFVLDLFASVDSIAGELLSSTGSLKQPNGKEGFVAPSLESAAKQIYNACLVNWYTPEHTIGLHSDDEAELDTSWPIFSLSWGGPRRFLLRPKAKLKGSSQKGVAIHEVLLKDGDLLIMGGKCQEEFKHEVPKVRSTQDGLVGNRISWTIRRMRPNRNKVATTTQTKTVSREASKSNAKGAEQRSHQQYPPHGVRKRTSEDSSGRPLKKSAIYNPYARSR